MCWIAMPCDWPELIPFTVFVPNGPEILKPKVFCKDVSLKDVT